MKTAFLLITMLATFALSAQAGPNVYDVPLKNIDGKDTSLKAYQGKVILVVNVASKCGHTPQYEGLETLYRQYQDQGLVVAGFPCNDFGAQEPGTNEEIKEFCSTKYNVTFPMFDKLHVKGPDQHPLYAVLSGKESPFPGDVRWNFGKFLIGRDGKIVKRFEPGTKPDDKELVQAIETQLAAKDR